MSGFRMAFCGSLLLNVYQYRRRSMKFLSMSINGCIDS